MNPSDVETSDSTSSSSVGSSSLHEGDALGSPPSRVHDADGRFGSAERVHGASDPPSSERDTNDRDDSGHHARESQGDTPEEKAPRRIDSTARKIIKSPARSQNDQTSEGARDRTGNENEVLQPSSGANGSSSRQRPLSAPSKTYPFARHEELPSQDRQDMDESVGLVVGARVRASESRHSFTNPDEAERGSGKRGMDGKGNARRGRVTGSESNAGRPGLSMSSIFGVASQRRTSNERQTATPNTSKRGQADRSGAIGSGSPGRRKEGHHTADTPLSSEEFGLHRWKEYAVLRHGKNQRFVNSPHGREILQQTAAKIRTQEVEDLNRELKEMRALVEELHSALRAEQTEKSCLQARVIVLEREVEGMDFARRRWLREDASNRGRGSNLERRLAGNTGNLRTFLFGAGAKPETTKSATTEEPSRSSASRSRSPVGPNRTCGACGSIGGTGTSEKSSAGDEEHGTAEGNTAMAERKAVRRARETAELERSELRRRHGVEMSVKQSRIDKLKLEIRKLEAERDGLKQAAESQAGLFRDGYAELRACLKEMRKERPPLPSAACRSRRSSLEATLVTEAEERSLRGCREKQEEAGNGEAAPASVEAMLATEEGLNHQVKTLQSLLLEAVSAAAPASPMPAAVTRAADAVREGIGLPPLAYSARPPPLPHDVPYSSSSRPLGTAAVCAEARSIDPEPPGRNHPHESGSLERDCDLNEGLGLSGQTDPSREPRSRQHNGITPFARQVVADVTPRSTAEKRSDIEMDLETIAGGISDSGSIRPGPSRGSRYDDGCRSCTGSEGSGTTWVRVLPTDETSSEEDFASARSPQSHIGEKTRGSRWRGRDETIRRYLSGRDEGIEDVPSAASESRRRILTMVNQGNDTTQAANTSSSSSSATLMPTGSPLPA